MPGSFQAAASWALAAIKAPWRVLCLSFPSSWGRRRRCDTDKVTRGDHSAVPHCSHYILPSGQAAELQRAEVCAPLCHIFLVIQSRLTKFSSLGGTSVSCTFTGCSGDKLIDTCLVKNPWKTLNKSDTAKLLGVYIFSIGQVAFPQPHYYLHHPVLQTVILSVTINPPHQHYPHCADTGAKCLSISQACVEVPPATLNAN